MGHESVFGVVRDATPEILVDNFPNSSEKVNVSLSRGYLKRLVHFVDGILRDAVRAKAPCAAEAADLHMRISGTSWSLYLLFRFRRFSS
jgi:hypothetical protein